MDMRYGHKQNNPNITVSVLSNKKQTKMEITSLLHQMTDREQLCLKSYLHNPIQLSPSDADAIRKHLYWQLKHYKHEEKRKK